MRLIFDGITLGQAKNYGISLIEGLSGDLRNINIEIPDSDFTRNITNRLNPKIRTFSGVLVGDDAEDFRERKRQLVNKLRQNYTFTLEDRYQDGGGYTIFETYEFEGTIITIDPNRNFSNTFSRYVLQIQCADPFLYKASATSGEISLTAAEGIHLPVYLPAHFGDSSNTFMITNSGETAGYVDVVLTGGGNVWTVNNNTTGLSYVLNRSIADSDYVTINPRPSQPINTTDSSDNSLEAFVIGSYDTFKIEASQTATFTVDVNSGITDNSSVSFTFREPFIGI